MKSKIFLTMVILLCGSVPANADLMLYTFSGNMYAYQNPFASSSSQIAVTYRFLVDVDQPGAVVDATGRYDFTVDQSIKTSGTTTTASAMQYFYAELVGGELLPDLTAGDDSRSMMGVNVEYTTTDVSTAISTSGTLVFLNGGSFSHYVMLMNESTPSFDSWRVGTVVTGYEFSYQMDLTNNRALLGPPAYAISALRLTSIETPPAPPVNVPEPDLPLLLLAGTVPLFFVGLRKKSR